MSTIVEDILLPHEQNAVEFIRIVFPKLKIKFKFIGGFKLKEFRVIIICINGGPAFCEQGGFFEIYKKAIDFCQSVRTEG